MRLVEMRNNECLPVLEKEMEHVSGRRKNPLLFACSGLSNTGKLTMQAVSALAFRRPDVYRAAVAHKGVDVVEDAAPKALEFSSLTAVRIAVLQKNSMKPGYGQISAWWLRNSGLKKTGLRM
jgi:uncharacterized metal-binding protein